MSNVRVTVITEIVNEATGRIETSVTRQDTQGSGNPLFITRVAHRLTNQLADSTREMLQPEYGELDKEWRNVDPTWTGKH